MKFWEAMKLLYEGKKIRKKDWGLIEYIELDRENECIVDNTGSPYAIVTITGEWEIYDDRLDAPDVLINLYKAARQFEQQDCMECGKCPFYDVCQRNGLLLSNFKDLNKKYKLEISE